MELCGWATRMMLEARADSDQPGGGASDRRRKGGPRRRCGPPPTGAHRPWARPARRRPSLVRPGQGHSGRSEESAARVICVRPAGRARTVHNIEVDTTHAYYVATTAGTWTLVHNGCTWDDAAGGWVDTETGKPRTPTRFSELVSSKGRINYDDVDRLATQNGLTNRFLPPQNLDPNSQRFLDGGFKYDLGGEVAWGHGPDIATDPSQYAHNNPTTSISRPMTPSSTGAKRYEYYHTDGTWSRGAQSRRHLPLDNSPYKQ